MQNDPTRIIGEVLGEPADQMRNPVNAGYLCPYINSECTKRSQSMTGPYPVCTVWRNPPRGSSKTEPYLVCICPKRFYAVEFLKDVITHCWPGAAPNKPEVVHEIKMAGFGNVDFVVADVGEGNEIKEFVSVELQAIDITGSVFPAYQALTNSKDIEGHMSFGLNLANVYKRYVTQLISKGYFHHHWGTKIAAVIQDVLYDDFQSRTPFPEVAIASSNIVFMVYRFEKDPDDPGKHRIVLDRVCPTHHSNLQNAVLYKTPPSKEAFCDRIKAHLDRE